MNTVKRTSIVIYDYRRPSEYLREVFKQIKSERPGYSIRAWSHQLETRNPTSLARILADERKVPKAMIPRLCNHLGLDRLETAYFELMAIGSDRMSPDSFEALRIALRARVPGGESTAAPVSPS